jgi:RimJ/RimL family protein N-acetyltransferase
MAEITWGERVGIRPLMPWDAWKLHRYLSDPEVAHLLFEDKGGNLPSPLALAFGISLARLSGKPDFAILDRGGRLIGSMRLWRVSEANRSAMLTIFIGEKDRWGQGLGAEALRLLLRHAFGPMGLNRVELHVFDFNQRAIRSYEKVGFVREGVRRKALVRGHRFHDILVMGILRDEFIARESQAAITSAHLN